VSYGIRLGDCTSTDGSSAILPVIFPQKSENNEAETLDVKSIAVKKMTEKITSL